MLDGMREELKHPQLIEAYARKYNDERQLLAANATGTRTKLEARRIRIENERQRNIDLVIKRVIDEEDARSRISELKAEISQIEAAIAALNDAPSIISVHRATLDRYVETADALATSLADHARAADDRGPLVASFRALVHKVTIHPNGPRKGFEIEVKGRLAALARGQSFPPAPYSGGCMVAGEGLEPPTRGL